MPKTFEDYQPFSDKDYLEFLEVYPEFVIVDEEALDELEEMFEYWADDEEVLIDEQ